MYSHGHRVPDSYCAIPARANVPSRVRIPWDMKFSCIFLGHPISRMLEKLTFITHNCPFSLLKGFTLFFLRQFFFSNVSGLKSKFTLVDLPTRSVQDRRFKKDLIKVSNYPYRRTSIWCSQRFKTRAAKKAILWKICLQGEVICVPSPQLTSLDSVFWQSKVLQGYSYEHTYSDYLTNTTVFHSTLAAVWFCCMKERRGTFTQASLHQRFWIFRLDYSVVQDFHMCGYR